MSFANEKKKHKKKATNKNSQGTEFFISTTQANK